MSARDVPMYQARQLTQGGEEIGRSEDSAGGGGLSNDPRVRVSTCSARLGYARHEQTPCTRGRQVSKSRSFLEGREREDRAP